MYSLSLNKKSSQPYYQQIEESSLLDIPGQSAILGAKLINYDKDNIPLNFSIWRGSQKFSFYLKTAVQ